MPTTQPHEAFMMEAADLLRAMSNKKRIIIKAANLVRTRRDAQTIFYSCDSEAVIRVLETLYDVFDKGRKRIAA
jgi:hypothetical protein